MSHRTRLYYIEVADNQAVLPIDEGFVREAVERTLDAEEVARAEISVALVDNDTIHELNVRYLEHDDATDVLSFLLECSVAEGDVDGALSYERGRAINAAQSGRTFIPRGRGKRIEGEIIVSAEMARDRAAEFGWSARDEVVLYVVHGALHLAGYDDTTDEEQAVMRSRERAILALWNLVPRYHDDRPAPGISDTDRSPPSPAGPSAEGGL